MEEDREQDSTLDVEEQGANEAEAGDETGQTEPGGGDVIIIK